MNYPIIVPTECEQRKIVDYLDAKCSKIDEIIERQQVIIEKLKEYKLSIITEAVTKGINPNVEIKDSGIEWIGYIPKCWNISRFKYLSSEIGDGLHSTPVYDSEKAQAKKEKAEKKPQAKKAKAEKKAQKAKKPKKPKEPDNTPPLPKKPVALIMVMAASFLALVLVGTNLFGYTLSFNNAKQAYELGDWQAM